MLRGWEIKDSLSKHLYYFIKKIKTRLLELSMEKKFFVSILLEVNTKQQYKQPSINRASITVGYASCFLRDAMETRSTML